MEAPGPFSIAPETVAARLGRADAPLLVDVRPAAAFDGDDRMLVGAVRRAPDAIEEWGRRLAAGRELVLYGLDGGEPSRGGAERLRAAGIAAAHLAGGIAGWAELGFPTRRKLGAAGKWVTRERPKVDRIACPWLVRRFIDPEAEFLYVPAARVREVAAATGAIPYDIDGVEFGHAGERCSFDAFLRRFDIREPGLDLLAAIVRGADTGVPELTPQSAGLVALSQGLSLTFSDDHEQLRAGLVMYDALYAWCRKQVRTAR